MNARLVAWLEERVRLGCPQSDGVQITCPYFDPNGKVYALSVPVFRGMADGLGARNTLALMLPELALSRHEIELLAMALSDLMKAHDSAEMEHGQDRR